jgi:lysozyme
MNLSELKDQLIIDEGVKYESYLDHLGLKTVGIGHLCREGEPEYDSKLGEKISEDRCTELFEQDIQTVIYDCKKIYDDWDKLPEEVQQICANMMFNLGYPRYSKFRKKIQAVVDGHWDEAANQMMDSRWYNQVPNRAKRLVERMRSIVVE